MRFKTKFLIILLIFIVLNIAAVSANDVNVTDSYQLDGNGSELVVDDYSNGGDDSNSLMCQMMPTLLRKWKS
ncbi:MAG: hypothetical protein IKH29_05195 [Methanobrevibacter sp.]|uniref:hypothetical protein n=1 Tax=Methanobrevibacter sp. TaxID=66852 RepID=UPI0025F500DC|nr:hypothetical protein [Methanobrevibacter sp.]MBR3113093.1 hypothetical protein [Methanobrevibacter sp.]